MVCFYVPIQTTYARKMNLFPTGINQRYQLIESHLLSYSWQLIRLQTSYVMDIKTPDLAPCKTYVQ